MYADDIHLVTTSLPLAERCIQALSEALSANGLSLNATKTKVLVPPAMAVSTVPTHLSYLCRASVERMMTVLGVPVGDRTLSAAYVRDRIDGVRRVVEAIGRIESPLAELRLLRLCGASSRLEYLALTTPVDVLTDAGLLDAADDIDRRAVAHVLRHLAPAATPDANTTVWDGVMTQVWLPARCGGFGVSRLRSNLAVDDVRPGFYRPRTEGERQALHKDDVDRLLAAFRSRPDSAHQLARFLEQASDNGLGVRWLVDMNPFVLGVHDAAVEATAVALALGLPVMPGLGPHATCPRKCKLHGRLVHLDAAGHHLLMCSSLTRNQRHNQVADALYQALVGYFGNGNVAKEVGLDDDGHIVFRPSDIRTSPAGSRWPADVYLKAGGRQHFVDITVSCALAKNLIRRAAVTGGAAADDGYERKLRNANIRDLNSRGFKYQPMALGSFGGIASRSVTWLRELQKTIERSPFTHRRARGEPARWQQIAASLSAAVMLQQAVAVSNATAILRGRPDSNLDGVGLVPEPLPVPAAGGVTVVDVDDEDDVDPAALGDGAGTAAMPMPPFQPSAAAVPRPANPRPIPPAAPPPVQCARPSQAGVAAGGARPVPKPAPKRRATVEMATTRTSSCTTRFVAARDGAGTGATAVMAVATASTNRVVATSDGGAAEVTTTATSRAIAMRGAAGRGGAHTRGRAGGRAAVMMVTTTTSTTRALQGPVVRGGGHGHAAAAWDSDHARMVPPPGTVTSVAMPSMERDHPVVNAPTLPTTATRLLLTAPPVVATNVDTRLPTAERPSGAGAGQLPGTAKHVQRGRAGGVLTMLDRFETDEADGGDGGRVGEARRTAGRSPSGAAAAASEAESEGGSGSRRRSWGEMTCPPTSQSTRSDVDRGDARVSRACGVTGAGQPERGRPCGMMTLADRAPIAAQISAVARPERQRAARDLSRSFDNDARLTGAAAKAASQVSAGAQRRVDDGSDRGAGHERRREPGAERSERRPERSGGGGHLTPPPAVTIGPSRGGDGRRPR